jgi:hypothetical protein
MRLRRKTRFFLKIQAPLLRPGDDGAAEIVKRIFPARVYMTVNPERSQTKSGGSGVHNGVSMNSKRALKLIKLPVIIDIGGVLRNRIHQIRSNCAPCL